MHTIKGTLMKRHPGILISLLFLFMLAASAHTANGAAYKIGTNFWNLGWGIWDDCFTSTSINWAATANPWVPGFLSDIAVYTGPFRMMDWCNPNDSTIVSWSGRTQKTADQHAAVSAGNSIAYEWMIDLANRTNHDLWICVPFKADSNYSSQLALLIKNLLNPDLKVYVEYSNETWNGGMTSFNYMITQGPAMGLPGSNKWYQGGAYSLWQSVKIWKTFTDVFGSSAMGTRVIRVFAFSGNFNIAEQAYINIVQNGGMQWNPSGQKADAFAIAPYIGPSDDSANAKGGSAILDGAQANIAQQFRANVIYNYNHYIMPAVAMAKKYNMPLCTYEGGQQLTTNAGAWSSNPSIDSEYTYMLNLWKGAGFIFFNHYTHTGSYSSGGAWGAKPSTTATTAQSPKYQAIVNWLAANPTSVHGPLNSGKRSVMAGISVVSTVLNSKVLLTISGLDQLHASTMRVMGLTGRILLNESTTSTAASQFCVGDLPQGTYVLEIKTPAETLTRKFVVKP